MLKKILIIDDSLFMRTILKDYLPDEYKVIEAASGSEAMEKFMKEKPDLTLLDIIMPDGEEEGLNVLRNIKKINPEANVVMVTAVGQKTVKDECAEMGVKDYILKPFDEKEIIEMVNKYLA